MPVSLKAGNDRRLIGNVRLHVRHDASLCAQIADDGYFPELGARSLRTTVDEIQHSLENEYLEVDERIRESEELMDFVLDLRKNEVIVQKC